MRTITTCLRRLMFVLVVVGFVGSAHAQRNVTLRLNTATLPDTLQTDSIIKVMGAVDEGSGLTAPYTLPDGNVISWSTSGADESTIEATNIGGDYWEATFQVPNEHSTMFKFFSQQAENDNLNGWEADPNPTLGPGESDTTLVLHYFESQSEWRGVSGDRGEWDWRPFESKEDSVAVWFRVAMLGEEARGDGYDPASEDQIVGLRGAPDPQGGLDWGVSVPLERESSVSTQVGNRMYSGVRYYPVSSVGQTQPYKFVLESGGVTSWEEGNLSGDRTFVVPAEDTTLYWVYYGNTAPSAVEPVESDVVFTVDLSPFEEIGLFDRARGDTLWVYGSFNGWQDCPTLNPDLCLMTAVPGDPQFELAISMSEVVGTNQDFKYFLDFNDETFEQAFGAPPPSGWEEAHATGTDRTFLYEDLPLQVLDLAFFNDVTSENVVDDGAEIDVHFAVDMRPAVTNDADPFDVDLDPVFVQFGDPIWAFTQGEFGQADEEFPWSEAFLEDADGDTIYTGTYTVTGPTYNAINFRYAYGNYVTNVIEGGSGTKVPGRNRVHYIPANDDGSWPTEYTLPEHTFQLTGALPFEENPAFSTGIEQLPGEQPAQIALGENYPNPFNPTTSFEYSLSGTEHVTVRVFDALGRLVATLVDGVQPAATYRVTFDASHLSSGVYLYQLKTPSTVIGRTMVLVK